METIGWMVEGERRALWNWATGGLACGRGIIPWMLEIHPKIENAYWRHLGNSRRAS